MTSNMLINNRTASTLLVGDVIAERAYYGSSEVFIAPEDVFDPDAANYIESVEVEDGQALEEGVKQAIDNFVTGCKADGIWGALKASCILAGARTLNGALVPLAGPAPTNFNFVSADYDRVTGLKGDGDTKYLDSNRAGNADPQNNHHHSVFVSSPNTGMESVKTYLGTGGGTGHSHILTFSSSIRFRNRANAQNPRGDGTEVGFMGSSRNQATAFNSFLAGVLQAVDIGSDGNAVDTFNVFSRSTSNYSNGRISFYSIGEAVDLAALDARVTTLMAEIEVALT